MLRRQSSVSGRSPPAQRSGKRRSLGATGDILENDFGPLKTEFTSMFDITKKFQLAFLLASAAAAIP